MKIKDILLSGLGVLALTACNDYLDVDAPSKYTTEAVFSTQQEINTALNGVYAKVMASNAFGSYLYNTVMLNSDVDMKTYSNSTAQSNTPRRFDITSSGSATKGLWEALYDGVESCNEFINGLENSSLYSRETVTTVVKDSKGNNSEVVSPEPNDYTQMMGEAKMMRAMFYSELVWYYGDVPFTMTGTSNTGNLTPTVTDRATILDSLINDLQDAQEYMYSDASSKISDVPERISKEAVLAMIARLALQAGGYSLYYDMPDRKYALEEHGVASSENTSNYYMDRPENYKDYYQIAYDAASSITGHSLALSYPQVFTDECSYISDKGDDVIFEIPFGKNDTGIWGYNQGPTCASDDGETPYSEWGETSGDVRVSAFYRYDFENGDARRDYVDGIWYYDKTGVPTMRSDYSFHNNKWSKLWSTTSLGSKTTGSTGINFAYIRYADVLLMKAEAANELGKTSEAQKALKEVRTRAFRDGDHDELAAEYDDVSDKATLLKAILDERKFEFAGENMRWKDLVRNNMYSDVIFNTFLAYYSIGSIAASWDGYFELLTSRGVKDYASIVPANFYGFWIKNPGDGTLYPNKKLPIFYVVDRFGKPEDPTGTKVATYITNNGIKYEALSKYDMTNTDGDSKNLEWVKTSEFTNLWGGDSGIKGQCCYSFYGYIRGDVDGNYITLIYPSESGVPSEVNIIPEAVADNLPPVRYILPLPTEAVQYGGYTQHYGYK